jgi:hypothetical protein
LALMVDRDVAVAASPYAPLGVLTGSRPWPSG